MQVKNIQTVFQSLKLAVHFCTKYWHYLCTFLSLVKAFFSGGIIAWARFGKNARAGLWYSPIFRAGVKSSTRHKDSTFLVFSAFMIKWLMSYDVLLCIVHSWKEGASTQGLSWFCRIFRVEYWSNRKEKCQLTKHKRNCIMLTVVCKSLSGWIRCDNFVHITGAFSVAGPTVWNLLPDQLKDSGCTELTFRRTLKTFFFDQY